jgi:hypothetical protein
MFALAESTADRDSIGHSVKVASALSLLHIDEQRRVDRRDVEDDVGDVFGVVRRLVRLQGIGWDSHFVLP